MVGTPTVKLVYLITRCQRVHFQTKVTGEDCIWPNLPYLVSLPVDRPLKQPQEGIAPASRERFQAVDPPVAPSSSSAASGRGRRRLPSGERFQMTLRPLGRSLALALSAVGIYGLSGDTPSPTRGRALGIRMALGATVALGDRGVALPRHCPVLKAFTGALRVPGSQALQLWSGGARVPIPGPSTRSPPRYAG